MLSPRQKAKFIEAVVKATAVIARPTPLTGTEWADKFFKLSPESSYERGDWVTAPYQVAILNAMCNDDIDEVNWQKSSRVGYTKLISIAIAHAIEHKHRNVAAWSPDDGARDRFSKTHIDSMIRDVAPLRRLFPWLGIKDKNNTISAKVFQNQQILYLLGGKAAKNYREISIDLGIYDELSKFDRDIEREGSPTFLGDKRLEGSVYGKSIRGSTPKLKGECQIEEVCSEADHQFYRYIPCPECGEYQALQFGGPDVDYGLKWDHDVPKVKQAATAYYKCLHNGCEFSYASYIEEDVDGYWASCKLTDDSNDDQDDDGMWTFDGIEFFDMKDYPVETPKSVAFYTWSVYSHWSPWSRIVRDWQLAQRSRENLQSFINTTLGETWEEPGSRIKHENLFTRRETYAAPVPAGVNILTGQIDTQDDRLEGLVIGHGDADERWSIFPFIVWGDPGKKAVWQKLSEFIYMEFDHELGYKANVPLWVIDQGGHYTTEVQDFCKLHEANVRPIVGENQYGKPIVNVVRKRNNDGVFLHRVGTDTAKTLIASQLSEMTPGPSYMHFPVNELHDEGYFQQLCAPRRITKKIKGRMIRVWDEGGRRNEISDLWVYALACLRILYMLTGLNMDGLKERSKELARTAKADERPKRVTKKRRVRSKGIGN